MPHIDILDSQQIIELLAFKQRLASDSRIRQAQHYQQHTITLIFMVCVVYSIIKPYETIWDVYKRLAICMLWIVFIFSFFWFNF